MSWLTKGPPKKVLLLSAIGSFVGGTYLLRDSFRGSSFDSSIKCEGKVAIVTGGNAGIGKETARELARRGAVVFLLCRDKDRCDRARKEIALETRNKYVYSRKCDLSSLESIRSFVKKFKEEEKRLDILINNASVWKMPYGRTSDGFEIHLGVNHMGHFLLTNLLLDTLKQSAPSRIVNIACATHTKGKINKEDLNSESGYDEETAYTQSKLANIMFTRELARRLEGTGVTANSVHPGVVATDLFRRNKRSLSTKFTSIVIKPFVWIFLKTPSGGAQTTLYAALDPSLEKVTGKHFAECREQDVAPQAKDEVTTKWLWAVSEKWTRLYSPDKTPEFVTT